MGRPLSTAPKDMVNTPVINVRGAKGSTFKGRLLAYKEVKNGYKDEKGNDRMHHIYDFAILDSSMEIQVKDGKEYKEASVNEGDTVAVFAPTRLHNALSQAKIGETLLIEYKGLGAARRGNKPHDYKVEVL